MAINRGGFARLLEPDLRKVHVEIGQKRRLEHPMWVNQPDMPWNPFTDKQLAGFGVMPAKPEGDVFTVDEPIDGGTKSYEAVSYGIAWEVTREMWRDDLYGPMRGMTEAATKSSLNRLEVDAHSILNNAFDTAFVGFTAAESLCSTSHARLDGGTAIANRPTVEIQFGQTGLQNGITRFENMVDERGLPSLMTAVSAVVGPSNKFVAREILGSSLKAGTAQNEINALIDEDLSYLVSHYFDDATQWFLLASKGAHDLNFFVLEQPDFDSFEDPWTGNAVFTIYQSHIAGFGSWRGIDGSNGG